MQKYLIPSPPDASTEPDTPYNSSE